MQKALNEQFKHQVADAIRQQCEVEKRFSKADLAKRADVSPAFVTHVMGGPAKWANYSNGTPVPEFVFQRLGDALGLSNDVFETANYTAVFNALTEAKLEHEYRIIDGGPGAGKTFACRDFLRKNPGQTYLLTCSDDLSGKEMIQELARIVGSVAEGTRYQIRKGIQEKLGREEFPLVIFDEAENLRDAVFGEIKAIHDALEYRCGIVLVGANDFYKGISRKAEKGKGCFPQIFSRFKTGVVSLGSLSPQDCTAICTASGIVSKSEIKEIYNACNDHRDLFRMLRRKEKDAKLIALNTGINVQKQANG
jgi:DNA transposition AAA+ family ATPase